MPSRRHSCSNGQNIVQDNVRRKIKRLPQEDPEIYPLDYEEVNRILDAIDPWYRPYTCVAFFTGMREGELNGLAWRDFLDDMKPEPQIFIRRSYVYGVDSAPKTKKSKRYIKCLPQVLDALAEQRERTRKGKFVFLTKDGKRMTPDHFRNLIWTPALEKAGLEYRPPMQMRHTFATMMLSAGEDPGWVQNMMGHTSLQMIFQRYYAWIPKATRSDGQAFLHSTETNTVMEGESQDHERALAPGTDDLCPKIVPLDLYRKKKGGRQSA